MTRQFIGSRALPRLSSGIERILLVDYRGIQSRAVIMFDALESLLRTRQEMVTLSVGATLYCCGAAYVVLRKYGGLRKPANTWEFAPT